MLVAWNVVIARPAGGRDDENGPGARYPLQGVRRGAEHPLDSRAEWFELYTKELGVEVLITDDNDSYSVAAAELVWSTSCA